MKKRGGSAAKGMSGKRQSVVEIMGVGARIAQEKEHYQATMIYKQLIQL